MKAMTRPKIVAPVHISFRIISNSVTKTKGLEEQQAQGQSLDLYVLVMEGI